MKTFKLFGYEISIQKRKEIKEAKNIPKEEKHSSKEAKIDLSNAPQLVKDAYKCSKCWNTEYCACNRVAKYLLEVGLDAFVEQAKSKSFPHEIEVAVKAMDHNLLFAYEVDPEYTRILEVAKGQTLK